MRRFGPAASETILRQAFTEDGFLVIEDFVAPEDCDALRARMVTLVAAFDPTEIPPVVFSSTDPDRHAATRYFEESSDKIRFFFEEGAVDAAGRLTQPKERALNKSGHALHDCDPVFSQFSRMPALVALSRALGLVQPLLLQSMYIFKQPSIGGEVGWHQDATYLLTEPSSVLGFWFALEDADAGNGALMVQPGGHKGPLRQLFYRHNGKLLTDTLSPLPWPKPDQAETLAVRKGTLVVLHGMLPHASNPNCSGRSRHAYTLHVIDGQAHYPERNWLRRSPTMPLRGFD
ncbi:MAG TPA: phytanoyl-CoA dioxygenase family protein [Dongiaceae bacterium]|jgi:phytanoyl-CoA hydroxylase|nr:phytanoyl-CoA dioxygenase family protein [Dongiaceae bacterium]